MPSNKKYHVDQAVWASKVAWLMESSRSNVTGDALSDVRLNQLYQQGRRSYLRQAEVLALLSVPDVLSLVLRVLWLSS